MHLPTAYVLLPDQNQIVSWLRCLAFRLIKDRTTLFFKLFALTSGVTISHPVIAEDSDTWNLITEHQNEAGFLVKEGLDSQRENFRPLRELFLTSRGKTIKDSVSLHWNLRWSGNRNLEPTIDGVRPPDEIYYHRRRHLTNGSILDQNQQLLVKEGYFQWLEEGWLLQGGAIRYAWGTADFINPISVVSSKDLRYGLSAEKDQQFLSTTSIRLTRLLDEQSLTIVYVPLAESSLIPSQEHNWNLDLDNQRFRVRTIPDEKVRNTGNVALKYDLVIPSGDLSFIYYNGTDSDLITQPASLTIRNNAPLMIDLNQVSVRKNSWGGSYQQTFDGLVLKLESLYTSDKKAPKNFDRTKVESLDFPIEMTTSPHLASSAGINYFLNVRDILGIKLSETVLTTEIFSQKHLKSGVLPGLSNQILAGNLRTGAMEDRLEILLTYLHDLALDGQGKVMKISFSDDNIKHTLNLGQFDGKKPDNEDIGSLFYYFRARDYASYELSYSL